MTDYEKLQNMKSGETEYINFYEGGGAEVIKVGDKWELFGVSMYGGEPMYIETFNKNELYELIDIVNSWT